MPKYLIQASYTAQGVQGLQKEGGSARRSAVQAGVEKAGGRLESFYFAFGESDAFIVVDVPDAATAAALSLAVNASGTSRTRTTPLLTCEEMDAAAKKGIDYRPPGGAQR
jgi:uncharacterized protein with GYD domain